MIAFALATIQDGQGLENTLVIDGKLCSPSRIESPVPSPVQGKSVKELLEDWSSKFPLLQDLASRIESRETTIQPTPVEQDNLSTPIRPQNKLAAGANYASHLQGTGLPAEKWNTCCSPAVRPQLPSLVLGRQSATHRKRKTLTGSANSS